MAGGSRALAKRHVPQLYRGLHADTVDQFDPHIMTFHPKLMMSWQEVVSAGPDQSANGK